MLKLAMNVHARNVHTCFHDDFTIYELTARYRGSHDTNDKRTLVM